MVRRAFIVALTSAFVLVGFTRADADTRVRGHYSDTDGRVIHDPAEAYEYFYKSAEKIVKTGRQVAEGQKEQTDIRVLQFYLTRLRRAIDAGDWKQAAEIRDRVKGLPSFQRSNIVAADAKRRLTVRQRADEERRHREEMKQRERVHQAEMRRQEAILNALRNRQGY